MEDKKQKVEKMFDSIAPRYDFLNHFLSLGIDQTWRRKLAKQVAATHPQNLLDVATGTGDMAVALHKVGIEGIVGVDLSEGMLKVGREKMAKKNIDIQLIQGQAERLPGDDCRFDAVTCAFGVRNFENVAGGLKEMCRVLKQHKHCFVLEYSKAEKWTVIGWLFKLYFRYILPTIGGWVSGNRAAYSYLPESVENFVAGDAFLDLMRDAGFENCKRQTLLGGWVTIYDGTKK